MPLKSNPLSTHIESHLERGGFLRYRELLLTGLKNLLINIILIIGIIYGNQLLVSYAALYLKIRQILRQYELCQ